MRLITIPISHYCEKARWALEYAGIPYAEERHLQVFHFLASFRAAWSDSVPVLVTPDGVMDDSKGILRWSDARSPAHRRLYPFDATVRQEVEGFEDRLDEGFGVEGRLWMYSYLLQELPLVLKYSRLHGVPSFQLRLLPLVFPVLRKWIHRILDLRPSSRLAARDRVSEVFDEVAAKLADGRLYLFGDQFSAADLTFAALSSAVLIPDNYGVPLPDLSELPEEMADQVRKWRSHPAGRFASRIYRECRRIPPV